MFSFKSLIRGVLDGMWHTTGGMLGSPIPVVPKATSIAESFLSVETHTTSVDTTWELEVLRKKVALLVEQNYCMREALRQIETWGHLSSLCATEATKALVSCKEIEKLHTYKEKEGKVSKK